MNKVTKILLGIVVVIVAIQFFHPGKNVADGVQANNVAAVFTTPEEVKTILAKSCNDCHSNNTIYPWYNNIQPVAWWLNHHVSEAKEKLNFDEFASYSPRRQYNKLKETEELLNENEMPLSSYVFIHRNAVLSAEQKETLINWTKNIRKQMEATYPMDSLLRKKQNQKP
ncbi:MAG: heme-binding domain-containing protein [Bacteroidetes bacterium]|nr:heme-binding domain-containing protein [Bacteroidota bacterium]